MVKFTYECNGTREDHRYCKNGNEDRILTGWNRLGKATGHSYKIIKVENVKDDGSFVRIGSSEEFVKEDRYLKTYD